jgi:hypothetical protein
MGRLTQGAAMAASTYNTGPPGFHEKRDGDAQAHRTPERARHGAIPCA